MYLFRMFVLCTFRQENMSQEGRALLSSICGTWSRQVNNPGCAACLGMHDVRLDGCVNPNRNTLSFLWDSCLGSSIHWGGGGRLSHSVSFSPHAMLHFFHRRVNGYHQEELCLHRTTAPTLSRQLAWQAVSKEELAEEGKVCEKAGGSFMRMGTL